MSKDLDKAAICDSDNLGYDFFLGEIVLTPKKLIAIGRLLYGDNWQTPLARDLGVNDRSVRKWVLGERSVPKDMPERLREVLKERRRKITAAIKAL